MLILLSSDSFAQRTILEELKHAVITPVYKGNNKNQFKAESYRLITLTSVTCKLMEHIMHSHIMKHLYKDQTLSETQHGFKKFRSCETQLLKTINNISSSLNNREKVDSIFLDFSKAFSKAFDKVCYQKLLLKFDHYEINGNIYKWISNFLQNRTKRVVVRGTFSETVTVLSGVPQGTVLGPLLFLLYINDMPLVVKSIIALFADDAYVYRSIFSCKVANTLQKDLENLGKWEKNWSMEFHPNKCHLLG